MEITKLSSHINSFRHNLSAFLEKFPRLQNLLEEPFGPPLGIVTPNSNRGPLTVKQISNHCYVNTKEK